LIDLSENSCIIKPLQGARHL